MSKMAIDYVAKMAERTGNPITITTGTNHSKFTTNGNVSDHFKGNAADIGMFANGGTDESPVGDRIMEACCFLGRRHEARPHEEKARTGGLFTFTHDNQRIQCIWKTNKGGNHHTMYTRMSTSASGTPPDDGGVHACFTAGGEARTFAGLSGTRTGTN